MDKGAIRQNNLWKVEWSKKQGYSWGGTNMVEWSSNENSRPAYNTGQNRHNVCSLRTGDVDEKTSEMSGPHGQEMNFQVIIMF
jgi:hypothetical protein